MHSPTTAANISNNAANVGTLTDSLQTENINYDSVTKTNWTWPGDVYASTGGYKSVKHQDSNATVFSIDSAGLVIKKNPLIQYNLAQTSWWKYDQFEHIMKIPAILDEIIVSSQSYDIATDSFLNLVNDSKAYVIGRSPISVYPIAPYHTLDWKRDYNLSFEQPYLKIKLPLSTHKITRYTNYLPSYYHLQQAYPGRVSIDWRSTFKSINTDVNYAGNMETISNSNDEGDCKWDDRFGGGSDEFCYHTITHHYRTTISIFNDYDASKNLIGTHMLNHADNFNSKMPAMKLDKTKLAKKTPPSKQNINVDGFITLSNGESLPSAAIVTATKNDNAGEIVVNYKPKTVFVNGILQNYTGPWITQKIDNLFFSLTNISAKSQYPTDIVVDRFINSISKTKAVLDPKELDKYLDFESVPNDSIYEIHTIKNIDLVKGTIDFIITTSKSILNTGAEVEKKEEFPISLTLTPRITKFTQVNQNPDNLAADKLKAKLFDGSNDKLDQVEFAKYQTITAPVDDADYFLVPNSFVSHTGDGIIKFKLYPNNFYNSEADLTAGDATKPSSHFSFAWQLTKTPTIIEKVGNVTPEIRVDHFRNAISDASGHIIDLPELKKYIEIEHLPNDSILSISDISYSNYTLSDYRDTITFKLKATKFNKTSSLVTENEIKQFSLKLLPQYKPTDVVAKKTPINPHRIDVFKDKIETLSGTSLTTYLKDYLDFTSLRDGAVVSAVTSNYDPYNGNLKLNIAIQKYYDNNSDENSGTKAINELLINLTPAPTEVEVIKDADPSVRLDRFVKTFADVNTGVVNNLSVLQQYLSFDVWDPNTILTIDMDSISMNNATGEWNGDLIMAEANDTDSSRVNNKCFPLAFKFAEKYDPTSIEQIDAYPLVQLDDFESYLFDENGIAKASIFNYVDVHSLPPNAKIKLMEEPKIDYPNAQITITIDVTSYFDDDSDLQQINPITRAVNSTPLIKTFTFDLLSPETAIKVVENYDQSPRVDRFAESIKNLTDDDLKLALEDYVSFDYLPANNNLRIDPNTIVINNVPGILKFDVMANRYFDTAGYLQTTAKAFPITLNLADKYATTSITSKNEAELPSERSRVDRFITELGATPTNPEITNLALLNQYVNIVSLPLNTELSVDYTQTINSDADTGILNFSIAVNSYYDINSDLQAKRFSFPISLNLTSISKPTTIIAKTSDLPETRADQLLKTFVDPMTNKVTNIDVLKQYVTIDSLPSSARLYVAKPIINSKLGTINFDLIASKYYDLDGDLQTDSPQTAVYPFTINLQLVAKVDATNFIGKTVLNENVLVNELTAYIAPKGIVNRSNFEEYIDIISLPSNAYIELKEMSHSTTTGILEYEIEVNQYYDEQGDLRTRQNTYNVIVQVNPLFAETQIYALSNYPNDLNVTAFKKYVTELNGAVNIQNLSQFVAIESLPSTSQLSLTWGTETISEIQFIINASEYYNNQNRLDYNKDFSISLSFANHVLPTNIKAWDTYPAVAAHKFFNLVNPNNNINYAQLSKYLDLSTVPYNASLKISNPKTNTQNGLVSFNITTDYWYDENKDLQSSPKTFNIKLNLVQKFNKTDLFGIVSIDKHLTLEDFWLSISTNNQLDHTKLAQYVNLDTLVPNTDILYLNPVKAQNGDISFELVTNRFYDDDGLENHGRKVFRITLNSLNINTNQQGVINYTWLYVTLALVMSSLGGLTWFLINKNKKHKEK